MVAGRSPTLTARYCLSLLPEERERIDRLLELEGVKGRIAFMAMVDRRIAALEAGRATPMSALLDKS